MKRLILFLVALTLLMIALASTSEGQVLQPDQWVTDGAVYALASSGNTLYVGGQFSYVGPKTSTNGAALDATTGVPASSFPDIDGTVTVAVPDGAGGWYIGGYFNHVGTQVRNNAARINSNGTLHAWDPDLDGEVSALVLSGSTVYIGGSFSTVGGEARNNIAAVDAATGAVDPSWDPSADGSVQALALSSTNVYAAGDFQNIGSNFAPYLAELDRATGLSTSTLPTPDAAPLTLAFSNNTLFLGGDFTDVGGNSRNNLASIDVSDGSVTDWDPEPNSLVYDLKINGSSLYVAGGFDQIGADSRQYIAEFDASTGSITSWQPSSSCSVGGSYVQSISIGNGTVYAVGAFWHCVTPERFNLSAWDAATGAFTSWAPTISPGFGNFVGAVAVSGSQVYVGGSFTSVGGTRRNSLAAIDATTGAATDWNPNPVNESGQLVVFALTATSTTVYVGGEFTKIGGYSGTSRNDLAAIDAATGIATNWNPDLGNGIPFVLKLDGSLLYVGGEFTTIRGQSQNNLAAVDVGTGVPTNWNPNPVGGSGVRDIEFYSGRAYIAGSFSTVGGQSRTGLAALDLSTGAPTNFNPNPTIGVVSTLSLSGNTLYVGGAFTSIAGQTRRCACSFTLSPSDPDAGTLTNFNPNCNPNEGWGGISDLLPIDAVVYVGGLFNAVGGQTRGCLAALNASDGSATSWNPPFIDPQASGSQGINSLSIVGTRLFGGGRFDNVGTEARQNLIGFEDAGALPIQLASSAVNVLRSNPGGSQTSWDVEIAWKTVSEINNYGFELYRKRPGESEGRRIGFVEGHGTTLASQSYSFIDHAVSFGSYSYQIKQVDLDGTSRIFPDMQVLVGVAPESFFLAQNYPNPFNPNTVIEFAVPNSGYTTLKVYNVLGQEVAQLFAGNAEAGMIHSAAWEAATMPSGVYFYTLRNAGSTKTKRMLLMK